MIARVKTSVISDLNAIPVDVEAKVLKPRAGDNSRFDIIGLADTAIREARQRVESALLQIGIKISGKVLINLSPAEIKKDGSSFDLPISLSILLASGKFRDLKPISAGFYGELSLDGKLKPVRSILAHALSAKSNGINTIYVPEENRQEAELVDNLNVVGLNSLLDLIKILRGEKTYLPKKQNEQQCQLEPEPSLAEVIDQQQAKRAMLLAAAGGHNILFIGPPGCGKSMMAMRLPALLPALTDKEKIETAKLHSFAGHTTKDILLGRRPFRSPHHVISDVGLVGGGSKLKAGEISLAHNGVLFLDEFPEYKRTAIEALRAPLETGKVLISRAKYSVVLPANFQLITAMNPCPCGKLGVPEQNCLCSQSQIQKYLQKISGPILDRIDLQVSLQPVNLHKIKQTETDKITKQQDFKEQTVMARQFAKTANRNLNARLSNKAILTKVKLTSAARKLLDTFSAKRHLSARAFFRTLKLARTIADYSESSSVNENHLAEALSFRSLDIIKEYTDRH